MVDIHQLTVKIGAKAILQSINLQLNVGEVTVILGANGAGKSTLLKAIGGIIPSALSSVKLHGRRLNTIAQSELAKQRGIFSQSISISHAMKVWEVVALGRFPYTNERKVEQQRIVFEQLEALQLLPFADRIIQSLSGGERQRVHFARVLTQLYDKKSTSLKLLLLDEPSNNLDIKYQFQCLEKAKQFSRQGHAVVAVLHDIRLAAQFADRIVLLKEGKLLATGKTNQALTSENLSACYDFPITVVPTPQASIPQFQYGQMTSHYSKITS